MGFQAQSFFTGFGQFLAYISLFLFPIVFVGYTGSLPTWIYASFFLGAVLSVTSIWWSMSKTKEIPPTEEELAVLKAEPLNVFSPFIDIYKAVLEMPAVMWQLFLVYLFQWYAMMCYWQNNSKSIALSVWNVTPKDAVGYEKAVEWNGLIGAFGFIVTFSIAFYLAKLAKRHGAKMIHFVCLVIRGGFSFMFPNSTKSICVFCCGYWLRYCLGKYDGNSLFDGCCCYFKRKIWRLHGYYQYDDCDPNDYSKPFIWLYFKKFLR